MLNQNCQQFTDVLKDLSEKVTDLDVVLDSRNSDLADMESRQSEIDKITEETLFDEAILEKEIVFNQRDELIYYEFYTRNPLVSENSFAFSGNKKCLAIQSSPRTINFYDANLDMLATFSIDKGELIRNFYFIGDACIIDFYRDDINGIKTGRYKFFPVAGGTSNRITKIGEYFPKPI